MTLHVAITHRTEYRYDRPVQRRAACRAPAAGAALPHADPRLFLRITPTAAFRQLAAGPVRQLPGALVVPGETREFTVTVDLVADMAAINPFDFFVEECAANYPFAYDPTLARRARGLYLRTLPAATGARASSPASRAQRTIIDFLVEPQPQLQRDIAYACAWSPACRRREETLESRSGSCRDSGWLLVQILRRSASRRASCPAT